MNQKLFIYCLLPLISSGCASLYNSVKPTQCVYTNSTEADGIMFSYRYNILRETGNIKYSKKELRKGVHIVAVKIKNYSDKQIHIGSTLNLYINDTKAAMMDPILIHQALKQSPYVYLLYLFLTPIPTSGGKRVKTEPPAWEYAIGPGLALINIVKTIQSNKRFLAELNQFNLIDKTINPGDEVYGLVGLPYTGYDPLSLRIEPK